MSKKKKIELLEQARKYIDKREEMFLCVALKMAARAIDESKYGQPCDQLLLYISRSLEKRWCLEVWYADHHGRTLVNGREARLEWIDWMIKCLKGRKV